MKSLFTIILSLACIFFFFLAVPAPIWATTYYVATTGSDTDLGTIAAPWKTLVYAAGKLAAGDTLYLRGGVYQEKVTFSHSGTSSQPITIAAYSGETPIIDGNYQIPVPSFSALIVVSGSYLTVDGLEVRNSFWQGVEVSGTNVTLSHITSHDNMEHGIITWGSTDVLVEDSTIYNNAKSFENGVHQFSRTTYATGISAAGASNRTTIRRVTTYHNWGEGLSTFNATNTTMEDNIVYDNAKQVYVSDTTGTLVQRNLIYCTPGNIHRLSATVTQHGINLQDENQQPASANNTIINNLVVGCVTNFKWYPFTSNSAMTNILIANNTFVNATGTTSDAAFTIASPTTIAHTNSRIINNIIEQDDSKTIGSFGAPTTGITFANNLWSKAPPATMMGSNSLVADPLLLKSGSLTPGGLTADYGKLSASSPAINQGMALTEVTSDYFSAARPASSAPDIGAHEYTGAAITPSPILTLTPTQSTTPGLSPTQTATPSCPLKQQGDADCDGKIKLADFSRWRQEFFGELTTLDADFNGSGNVTLSDHAIWRQTYFDVNGGVPSPTP